MRNKNQKIKLLRIWETLRQETDEEHTLSTVQLMERLTEEGVKCERKSIYDDVRSLQELGYPVEVKRTKVNEYYVADRSFSTAELRLLMDSVQAANFLSDNKTKELTSKIAALAGNAKGERLRSNTQFVGGKRRDDAATDNLEKLQSALEKRRKVSFGYYDLDVKKERVFRTRSDGSQLYVASPKSLVCKDDNYYMLAVMEGRDHYVTYRVDRMSDINILRDKVTTPEWCKQQPVSKYLKSTFGMFSGNTERVTMLCKNQPKVINMVLDEFGYDTRLVDRKDGTFYFATDVQVSPVFFAWLMTTGDNVRLYSPQSVCEAYKNALKAELIGQETIVDK
jgi:predicted DNA-binding transcriptional regulator YafY